MSADVSTIDEIMRAHSLCRLWLRERDGVWCLVDAIDFEWARAWKWNCSWGAQKKWKLYAKRNTGPARETVRLHREIVALMAPDVDLSEYHIHHINGQSLDNRRINLELTSPARNSSIRIVRGTAPTLEEIVLSLASSPPLVPADASAVAAIETPY